MNKRVKISSVVKNQLPDFVRADFPLAEDFLSQYYTALESQGSTLDLIQNLDQYIKVDELTNLVDSTSLSSNVGIADNTITVDSTTGFPDSYGLIEIDSEIITYTGITPNSFTGCSRGFSGITSYRSPNKPDELVFSQSGISTHASGSTVNNLSIRFLQEFFKKVKRQITPGFEERTLSTGIDKRLFVKQSKDFYSSKGTNRSFEILFRALYGKDVDVIKPRDYLFIPSSSDYRVSKQIVVESIEGNPEDLINRNLFQDNVDGIPKAVGAISDVETIIEDKVYYRLSLDYDKFNKSDPSDFTIHPLTKSVESVSIGSTVINVDSTVGFGATGVLKVDYDNGTSSTVKYTSKTLNQFFGCSGIDQVIPSKQNVRMDAFAYGYSGVGTANVVKVRVTGVLSDLDLNLPLTYGIKEGDIIESGNLGKNVKTLQASKLFYNICPTYNVASFEIADKANQSYKIILFDPHSLNLGDRVLINQTEAEVTVINNHKEVTIKSAGNLVTGRSYTLQKLLSKAKLTNYPESSNYSTNVQNAYKDSNGVVYVTSPSIPSYFNEFLDVPSNKILFSGSYDEDTQLIIANHGFITGDHVVYSGVSESNKLDITEKSYYIRKVDNNTIKISHSLADISNDNYVSFSGTIENNVLELFDFSSKTIESQKLVRKLPFSVTSENKVKTKPGKTGILVNGVEILNYKSKDIIYYGSIEQIDVLVEGSGYDVINPPILTATSTVGSGLSAYCEVEGNVDEIQVLDGGFDYLSQPTIKISGGNGSGCIAIPNLTLVDHSAKFNSIESAGLVDLTNNTIAFSTYHKFRDGELITYDPEGQTAVAGLTTFSPYYCAVKNSTTVSLHTSFDDAIAGISSINLTDYGVGTHLLKCNEKKRIVSSVSIASSGIGYKNKLTSTSTGISTSLNIISIDNHGYHTGDLIRYDAKSTPIVGLSTLTDYYVKKVDDDSFRLSAVGVGSTAKDFYLRSQKYVDFVSSGSGIHEFNYPPIEVSIIGNIGVSTLSGQDFNASLRPIVRGSIKSVYIADGGIGYGSSDIINYNKQLSFTFNKGKDAQLHPVVENGKITDVVVLNSGSGYNSPPNLKISGSGQGSVVIPIIEGGQITSVKVVHSGIGYTSSDTVLSTTAAGSECSLYSAPKVWTINKFEQLYQEDKITLDDGVVSDGNYGLQYNHLYAPRKLRQSTYRRKVIDQKPVLIPDLVYDNGIEEKSEDHSPIIGWAYDGHPIYGPYGYSTSTGGDIKILKSGYVSGIATDRPDPKNSNGESIFPQGYFVEDFTYSDDYDLDEHNGRFCKTPEFPKGTYAYFSTINSQTDSEGSFKNNNRPQFPYFIGNSFNSKPIDYNFNEESNQDNIDFNKTDLVRNTFPYNFDFGNTNYDFVFSPPNKSKTKIISVESGHLKAVGIETGGIDYQVGDRIIFDNKGTGGLGANAQVSQLKGKDVYSVSIANTNFNDVEFSPISDENVIAGYTTVPHNLFHTESVTISGLSTNKLLNNAIRTVGVFTDTFRLYNEVNATTSTGIVTFFNINEEVDSSLIRENDILGIGTEKVKVLNVDELSSRIRVLRNYDSTIGSAHTATSLISQKPRSFSFQIIENQKNNNFKLNKELYFNPKESVGLGTLTGVGIGSTLVFANPGAGISEIFIPTKSLYFENHGLETGDILTYRTNDGTALGVSTDGIMDFTLDNGQTLYAAKLSNNLIGIATGAVGLGSTGNIVGVNTVTNISTLYFTGIGTGVYHSLKTNYSDVITGKVQRSTVTVSTASTHGLKTGNTISFNGNPGITTTINVAYNDYNRRLVINPRTFVSGNVNTTNNTITISRHGYIDGQKIIHTATTSSGGLIDNGMYFVYVVDENTIKLCNDYYQSVKTAPEIISLTSASGGTISPINPGISLEKNEKVIFDLSDSSLSFTDGTNSYSAFDFNIYSDINLNNVFKSSQKTNDFNIEKSGIIGVDSNAKLTIKNIAQLKAKLYYNLIPIDKSRNTKFKNEIIRDDNNIINSNSLNLSYSPLFGKHRLVGASGTTFSFVIPSEPKKLDYSSSDGNFSYTTGSQTSYGPISRIALINQGKDYRIIPGISSITSDHGKNAILRATSDNIGRVRNVDIENIGFDYPVDKTLKPNAHFPQVLKIDSSHTLERIGITSTGTNYTESPNLVLIDPLSNSKVTDVELDYELGDEEVTILKNVNNLSSDTPTIIPSSNSNGIKISNLDYNDTTKDVTVTIGASFSDAADYPFEVGKKVLIEGISVGVGSTGLGYNSENYNYKLFEILATHPNIGGTLGTVRYSLVGTIPDGEVPGQFKSTTSVGKITPEEYFPIFDVKTKPASFNIGETVVGSANNTGIVQYQNFNSGYITVLSSQHFPKNNIITGEISRSQATISRNITFISSFNVGSSSIVKEGWKDNLGFLNDNQQRIIDSNYYQFFSYALQSEVQYDKWNEPVSSLNHTAGFKKFSDLIVPSQKDVGFSTTQNETKFDIISDLVSVMDLNCVFDFDLARERTVEIDSTVVSDEILLESKILQDYIESIGNRVLDIDDISDNFNSNPRTDAFMSVDSFLLSSARYKKYITYSRDRRYTDERQILVVSLLHNDETAYLNQYGRVETVGDLGSYDFDILGEEGRLLYYPKKFRRNDYTVSTVAFNIEDTVAGIGSTALGDSVNIASSTKTLALGTSASTTVVGIASTYRSSKVLVSYAASDKSHYEVDELTVVHDGTNVELMEYGQLTTEMSSEDGSPGLGTYSASLSGSYVNLNFTPNVSTASTYVINTLRVSIASTNSESVGVGTTVLNTSLLDSTLTSIGSSSSPIAVGIATFDNSVYGCAYYFASIEDTTNQQYQASEVIVATTDDSPSITEYGITQSGGNLGDFSALSTAGVTTVTFKPLANADVEVKVFQNALRVVDDESTITNIDLDNASIDTGYGQYDSTESDVKRAFDLKHKQRNIFKRNFVGSATTVINTNDSTITIPDHYFVTGEPLTYAHNGTGIQTSGGALSSSVFAIKVDESTLRLATSAENALKTIPTYIGLSAVGVGTSHSLTAQNPNSKAIISIDNIIQKPIVPTTVTTTVTGDVATTDNSITVSGITSIFGGDLVKMGDEIMKVTTVGFGATNKLLVTRPWMGTEIAAHSSGDSVTKLQGGYNIVDNTINFYTAPYGLTPISSTSNEPDDVDWTGISTRSTFNGRTFMRSGVKNNADQPYSKNYIFDDISPQFTGYSTNFTLKSNGSNIAGFSTGNAILLVNDVFQGPKRDTGSVSVDGDYSFIEDTDNAGITTVQFTGTISSVSYDPNAANVPVGGVIVSVGSTEGFGYQPLVAAGGTAVVSGLGTISSISIGNSGSGYRSGIQTVVNVGVGTSSTGIPNIEFIGTAAISGGNIVSVAITNPGTGYTSTNQPFVVFDDPLSYSNISLEYSSSSLTGSGTQAKANIIVGQGSSVIGFEITNEGYGYGVDQTLTIPVGGTTGIPTTRSFAGVSSEFQITIEEVYNDNFAGWTVGDFQVIDPLDSLFDGKSISFPLKINGTQKTIQSKPGSNVNVELTLLVFINDILQVPQNGYTFSGGSYITFKEAPKAGDTSKILFYEGTSSVDVANVDILETIKPGDTVTLHDDNRIYDQNSRTVNEIKASDSIVTNVYDNAGINTNENYKRPLNWCRQTEDMFIDGEAVSKDRPHYEPLIYPNTNIIQSVGVGSTVIFVSNVRTFFDSTKEKSTTQGNIRIISQDNVVGAAATAVVSGLGTISSITIGTVGSGYTVAPSVSISNPVGLGTIQRAYATSTISSGSVSSITVTTPGAAYTSTNPPQVLIGEPKTSSYVESIENVTYTGDFGIISGISTTSVGVASTGIVFDLLLPKDSLFRDASVVGSAITVSGISTGYYFVVSNSNVGNAVTSLYQDGTVVGIGTAFIDNVYEVANVSIAQTMAIGIGLTNVAQVTVSVQDYNGLTGLGYSEFFGDYSWGRIATQPRSNGKVFTSYAGDSNGLIGINTSPIIERTNPLKSSDYNT